MVGRPSKKIICGARRKYDGQPCQAKALKSGRCKYHGGMSTGAKTYQGKLRSWRNLKQYKNNEELLRRDIGQDPGEVDVGGNIDTDLQD